MLSLRSTPAGFSVYAASKAGLAGSSETLRAELRKTNVNVLTVYPGPVHSEMAERAVSSIQDGTSGGGHPTEQVSFSFAKIEEVFLGSNGKPVQQVSINLQNKLN